jgi:hypothetical protein
MATDQESSPEESKEEQMIMEEEEVSLELEPPREGFEVEVKEGRIEIERLHHTFTSTKKRPHGQPDFTRFHSAQLINEINKDKYILEEDVMRIIEKEYELSWEMINQE